MSLCFYRNSLHTTRKPRSSKKKTGPVIKPDAWESTMGLGEVSDNVVQGTPTRPPVGCMWAQGFAGDLGSSFRVVDGNVVYAGRERSEDARSNVYPDLPNKVDV